MYRWWDTKTTKTTTKTETIESKSKTNNSQIIIKRNSPIINSNYYRCCYYYCYCWSIWIEILLIILLSFDNLLINKSLQHGRMIDPPARNAMWRYGFNTPANYDDNGLYCGGFTTMYQINKGKCGICGDAYSEQKPRSHETGGKFSKGIIVRNYEQGETFNIIIEITANHMGLFTFSVCPRNDPSIKETEDCFIKIHEAEMKTRSTGKFKIPIKLPDDLKCSHCILRWNWRAANNWGMCQDGVGRLGCGPQETFRNCADISIGGDGLPLIDIDPYLHHQQTPKHHHYNHHRIHDFIDNNHIDNNDEDEDDIDDINNNNPLPIEPPLDDLLIPRPPDWPPIGDDDNDNDNDDNFIDDRHQRRRRIITQRFPYNPNSHQSLWPSPPSSSIPAAFQQHLNGQQYQPQQQLQPQQQPQLIQHHFSYQIRPHPHPHPRPHQFHPPQQQQHGNFPNNDNNNENNGMNDIMSMELLNHHRLINPNFKILTQPVDYSAILNGKHPQPQQSQQQHSRGPQHPALSSLLSSTKTIDANAGGVGNNGSIDVGPETILNHQRLENQSFRRDDGGFHWTDDDYNHNHHHNNTIGTNNLRIDSLNLNHQLNESENGFLMDQQQQLRQRQQRKGDVLLKDAGIIYY